MKVALPYGRASDTVVIWSDRLLTHLSLGDAGVNFQSEDRYRPTRLSTGEWCRGNRADVASKPSPNPLPKERVLDESPRYMHQHLSS